MFSFIMHFKLSIDKNVCIRSASCCFDLTDLSVFPLNQHTALKCPTLEQLKQCAFKALHCPRR